MITGHEDQRNVQHVHQRVQVLERQITAGQDQLGAAHRGRVGHQRVIDLIGDREHPDHTTIIGRGGHDAGPPGESLSARSLCVASVRGRFRRLPAYVEATLPQRRLHPVDLGLRSAVATLRRADIQPPAGRRQCIRVGAAQRLHPMVLSGQAGPGFRVLKLRAQPAQVGLQTLDRLAGGWALKRALLRASPIHPAARHAPMSANTAAVGSMMAKRNTTTVLTCPGRLGDRRKQARRLGAESREQRQAKSVDADVAGDNRTGRTGPRR